MDRNPVKLAFAFILGLSVVSLLPGTRVQEPSAEPPPARATLPVFPEPPLAARSETPQDRPSTHASRPGGGSGNQETLNLAYEQHVGLNACRVDTGVYVGEVLSVNYDGKQWIYNIRYLFPPPAVIRQPRLPIGNLGDGRHYEVQTTQGARLSRGPATDYTVTKGACRDGQPPERYVISGRVLNSQGLVLQDLVVIVTSPGADGSASASPTPIGRDGTFVTQPLLPGTYALEAGAAPFGQTKPPSDGAFAIVTVGTADVSGLILKTTPNITLTGRFRMESDHPRPPWPSQIHVGTYLAFDGMYLVPSARAEGGSGGTFTLRGVHGPRVLRVGYVLATPLSPWWPSQVLLDGVDITDIPTDFSEAEHGRLEIVFTQHPAGFFGTVADQTGKSVPFAFAVVFSADRALWHPWATTSNIVQADARGEFGFPTRPGRYLAVALPPDAFPSSRDARPNFEELSQKAITVRLGERERKVLSLRIIGN